MTQDQARKTANVILAAAAAGAAFYVLRTPSLRRMAFRFAGAALTGTIPAWLNGEVRRAWRESSRDDVRDSRVPPRRLGVSA
jgi:hypothetical protein